MIRLLGTSHVSFDSIKRIEKEIDKRPGAVCVELDPIRYHSLKTGNRKSPRGSFMKILYIIQNRLGKSTGMLPGQEMLYSVVSSQKKSIPCYLIDVDIRATVQKLKKAPLMQKIKLFMPTFLGDINLERIPSEKTIRKSLAHLRIRSPQIYKALIDDRNDYMSKWIDAIDEKHKDVLVVVGAGHVDGLERILRGKGKKVERV